MPLVSVLMPAKNAEAHLDEAVRSILGQALLDLELVAVDDVSTDRTGEILEGFARRDARIQVVKGPGRGISAALNAGLAVCRAPLIARMDADDVAHEDRLRQQVDVLESDPRLAAVGSQVEIIPRETMSDGLRAYEAWLNSLTDADLVMRERLVESPLVHPAATIRSSPARRRWLAR